MSSPAAAQAYIQGFVKTCHAHGMTPAATHRLLRAHLVHGAMRKVPEATAKLRTLLPGK